jgi:hypothetical protein
MDIIRRRLRLWVGLWLVAQVASTPVLVPSDCCLAHSRAAQSSEARCHHESVPQQQCAMRGTCDGPIAALLTLMSNIGVPGLPYGLTPELRVAVIGPSPAENLISAAVSPESPPPRV